MCLGRVRLCGLTFTVTVEAGIDPNLQLRKASFEGFTSKSTKEQRDCVRFILLQRLCYFYQTMMHILKVFASKRVFKYVLRSL